VVEVAHRNEKWEQLLADAGLKAFSRMTSIQVVVGVKIYSRHFRCFWARRRLVPNYGMIIEGRSDKLPVSVATDVEFIIPADLIFYGVPHDQMPPLPTPHLHLRMEILRDAIVELMQ
jgi:hypothetical protein